MKEMYEFKGYDFPSYCDRMNSLWKEMLAFREQASEENNEPSLPDRNFRTRGLR